MRHIQKGAAYLQRHVSNMLGYTVYEQPAGSSMQKDPAAQSPTMHGQQPTPSTPTAPISPTDT